MRQAILLVGALLAACLVVSLWFDEGEVVTLITTDEQAHEHETGLWLVDVDGDSYLRAQSVDTAWWVRARRDPDVRMLRGERLAEYRAIPVDDAAIRTSVDEAMSEKYGWLNRALLFARDHCDSVAIRLEPKPARVAAPSDDGAIRASP